MAMQSLAGEGEPHAQKKRNDAEHRFALKKEKILEEECLVAAAAATVSTAATTIATAATTTITAATIAAATAAATVSTTAATTFTAATAEVATGLFRTCFIHGEFTTADITTVELLDCCLCGLGGTHGHKCESTWTTGHPVHDHVDVGHFAAFFECCANVVFIKIEGQIANV